MKWTGVFPKGNDYSLRSQSVQCLSAGQPSSPVKVASKPGHCINSIRSQSKNTWLNANSPIASPAVDVVLDAAEEEHVL